jgi:hypothetical protein
VTTTSTPHASISNGTAPRPETLSTRISASGVSSRIAAASSGIGFMTPVEVSLWVSRTALASGIPRALADLVRGRGVAPLRVELRDVGP